MRSRVCAARRARARASASSAAEASNSSSFGRRRSSARGAPFSTASPSRTIRCSTSPATSLATRLVSGEARVPGKRTDWRTLCSRASVVRTDIGGGPCARVIRELRANAAAAPTRVTGRRDSFFMIRLFSAVRGEPARGTRGWHEHSRRASAALRRDRERATPAHGRQGNSLSQLSRAGCHLSVNGPLSSCSGSARTASRSGGKSRTRSS